MTTTRWRRQNINSLSRSTQRCRLCWMCQRQLCWSCQHDNCQRWMYQRTWPYSSEVAVQFSGSWTTSPLEVGIHTTLAPQPPSDPPLPLKRKRRRSRSTSYGGSGRPSGPSTSLPLDHRILTTPDLQPMWLSTLLLYRSISSSPSLLFTQYTTSCVFPHAHHPPQCLFVVYVCSV